jgi:hypothetical protein
MKSCDLPTDPSGYAECLFNVLVVTSPSCSSWIYSELKGDPVAYPPVLCSLNLCNPGPIQHIRVGGDYLQIA